MSSREKPARKSRSNGASGQTPHEFFEGLFEVLAEELERNPAFAERLAERLSGVLAVSVKAVKKRGGEAPATLLEMDLKAERADLGEAELRSKLGQFKNSELAAFIRARKLSDGPISKRPKNSLINIIMRAAR